MKEPFSRPDVLLVCPRCGTELNMVDALIDSYGWMPDGGDERRWVQQFGKWITTVLCCPNRECEQIWNLDLTETEWVELPGAPGPDADEFDRQVPQMGGAIGPCAGCEDTIFAGEKRVELLDPTNARQWCHETVHCLLKAGARGFRAFSEAGPAMK